MKQLNLVVILVLLNCISCNELKKEKVKEDSTAKFKSGYANLKGLKMYYEIHGEGKIPLVLIHGGGSTIETSFGNILPLLAKDRKVIAVELQAHGRTSDRPGPVTFEQDADDVAALLETLKIDFADILGFSNGGNTAMQIAIRHPSVAHKLVVISAFYKREGMISGFFEGMEKASLKNMPMPLQEAYVKVAPDKNQLQTMHDKDKERMLHFKDWTDDDLRSIKAPTLLMVADHDVMTVEHTVIMSRLIPNAELMVLPGIHGSFIGEICTVNKRSKMTETTSAMIKEFLDK